MQVLIAHVAHAESKDVAQTTIGAPSVFQARKKFAILFPERVVTVVGKVGVEG